MKTKLLLCLLLLLMTGCGSTKVVTENTTEITTETVTETTTQAAEERLLDSMSLRQKVGQLFIVTPEALVNNTKTVTMADDSLAEGFAKYPVGGVILFSKNIENPEQLKSFTCNIKACSAIPLFVSVDEEGGEVARLADSNTFDLPKYESMTAVGRENKAYDAGFTIGSYLNEYGFNLDFAPVADVNTNLNNPIIGQRAFSNNPQLAAEMVGEAVKGFHKGGVMCCLKHFPGHGDTETDSHKGYASTNKTFEEMEGCEMLPFSEGIKAGADMVMVGHITAPEVTDDGLPASLSKAMITGCLREKMGYEGVVVTDSMSMGAVTKYYDAGEAAVMAISAGADIVLMPGDLEKAFTAVEQAVESGKISEERLNESVLRILKLKHIQ